MVIGLFSCISNTISSLFLEVRIAAFSTFSSFMEDRVSSVVAFQSIQR